MYEAFRAAFTIWHENDLQKKDWFSHDFNTQPTLNQPYSFRPFSSQMSSDLFNDIGFGSKEQAYRDPLWCPKKMKKQGPW